MMKVKMFYSVNSFCSSASASPFVLYSTSKAVNFCPSWSPNLGVWLFSLQHIVCAEVPVSRASDWDSFSGWVRDFSSLL